MSIAAFRISVRTHGDLGPTVVSIAVPLDYVENRERYHSQLLKVAKTHGWLANGCEPVIGCVELQRVKLPAGQTVVWDQHKDEPVAYESPKAALHAVWDQHR